MRNVISWVEIYVTDMDRAKKFYETILDVELEKMPAPEGAGEMYSFPWSDDAPNAAGALVKNDTSKPSSTGTIVYFESEDCNTELNRVEDAGGTIVTPKTPAGEFGNFCIVSDSEGNMIGFFSNN